MGHYSPHFQPFTGFAPQGVLVHHEDDEDGAHSAHMLVNKRVLGAPTTGVQRYLMELARRWNDGVDYAHPVPARHGIKGHAWEQFTLPTYCSKDRVLFSPSNTGPLAIKRQVVTLHDVVALDHPQWLSRKFAAWYRFLTPRLARRVARVITISEFTKSRIMAHTGLTEADITVIQNGVGEQYHPRDEAEIARARQLLALPEGRYVLCVGSLEPRKNLPRLFSAWRRALEALPGDTQLIVCGARGNARIFADAGIDAQSVPRMHFTGHVDDHLLPALIAGATGFVYPSLYEGFGLPPLEAMASGVPTLTGNRTALPEVVGGAALTVDPMDVNAIADGLVELVVNETLRKRLIQDGLERARAFSWDRTARETLETLVSV